MGKFKDFAAQYKTKEVATYVYIECPRPLLEAYKAANWIPDADAAPAVLGLIKQEGVFQDYAYFFSTRDRKWYVISHLWIATLPIWSSNMSRYMEHVFNKMIKVKTKVVEEKPTLFSPPVVDESQPVDHAFVSKYGIDRSLYEDLSKDAVMVFMEDKMMIGQFCKLCYKHFNAPMSKIYRTFRNRGLMWQPSDIDKAKFHVELTAEARKDNLGVNAPSKENDAMYCYLFPKGVIFLSMILVDEGLANKPILPYL